ncbi:hypothetical protein [Peribacillus kribbensis]|uniref:hypothetical protein n=1 Tax=Peribacillus kribbensis TaxID=356658 RepID=UPI00041A4228|nr:hypothetical protein [Peribacillus kribbensis]
MKKPLLMILILLNLSYLALFLIKGVSAFLWHAIWLFPIALGIGISLLTLIRMRKETSYNVNLSIAVLSLSIWTLGTMGFSYFLAHMMG